MEACTKLLTKNALVLWYKSMTEETFMLGIIGTEMLWSKVQVKEEDYRTRDNSGT